MKIAYLTSACIPSTAANSVQSVRMCEAFASLGHEVTLFARHGDEAQPDLARRYGIGSPVQLVSPRQRGPKGLHTLAFLADIRREVRRRRPDVLFARDPLAALLLTRGVPLVLDIHAPVPARSIHDRALAWLTRRPELRRIVTITEVLKRLVLERYPWLPADAVVVLPNGAGDPTAGAEAGPAALSGNGIRVGHVGHLYRGRGVEMIIEAARRLPDLTFHLIGGRATDIAMWKAQSPPGNLIFHGYVPHAELGRYYAALDILVAPYASQVFDAQGKDSAAYASPMKIFEYKAAGLPIVATTIAGVLEVMTDGENSLLVPPDDAQSFAAALRRLADDAELRQRLGDAARRDYVRRHTWRSRAEAIMALYDAPCPLTGTDDKHSRNLETSAVR